MPSIIDSVRTELQLPASVIPDASITYVENKIGTGDLNLICAEVLRMVCRKYRGKIRVRIGKFEEVIDTSYLKQEINNYMMRSTATQLDDGFEYPDSLSLADTSQTTEELFT